jgi:serine/threonine protein kinase/Tol biopolymer transport system component/tetratricopeptide (TPR) repeat protein
MTPERWQHIKALLQGALERKPVERSSFLNEACSNDPSLRGEVESLIASYERAGGFIESPAFEVMAESLANDAMAIGSSLGPYKIIERLGAGGMGEVYLAEDTRLGRKVAVKVLPAHFTRNNERVRRFQQEARAASALNHPNIITIYEIGQVESHHFIATEFIEGETVRQHMARAQVKMSEALEIAIQAASALCAAHEAGIVHRDIKPENIMLRVDHIVKVLDFGLAKLTERKAITSESPTLVDTAQGMVMGTAFYMSPEQARGFAVDARTDIWSLAVVLYEMLAGRPPFEGQTGSDVIVSILDREPITLAKHSPDIPAELDWIVNKALRKDREERYQTTRDLLTDLKGLKRKLEFEEELERSVAPSITGETSAKSSRRAKVGTAGKRERASSGSTPAVARKRRAAAKAIDALAVLPLTNASPDPHLEYLSDGITESIINSLSQLPRLRVMARSSVFRYKGRDVAPQEIGRELGVRAVLTGRVLQIGERLVVAAELVDTTDETQLWGKHYNRDLSDIFEVQEEIAHEITEALRLRLTGKEQKRLVKRYTENTEAYQLYLKGRHFFNKRSVEGYRTAIEYYQQAIGIDPNYALAYAGLADCYANSSVAEISPKDAILKAKAAAAKALEIDDKLAEAHNASAHVKVNLDWDWSGAEREFKLALELNPNYAEAHHRYSHYLVAMGRFEESLTESFHGLELDPLDLTMNTHLGWHYLMARQDDEAIEQLKRTLELDKSFINARLYLARAYERKGMLLEAITEIQKARDVYGQSQIASGLLGHAHAMAGQRNEALKIVEELSEQSKREHVWPYNIAVIYVGLGERDEALQWLEKAYLEHSDDLIYLKVDPIFDPLRSDPRFKDLLRRVGLAPLEEVQQATLSSEAQTTKATTEQAVRLTTRTVPSQSWWSRREGKIFLALATLFLLAGLGYLSLRSFRRPSETPTLGNITFTQLTYQPGPEFFPSLSPDGKSLAYASGAAGNWDIYLQRVGGSNPINLTKDSLADDSQPAFSPDGERIAFRSERDGGGIYLMGATGESIIRISDFGYSPAWSPDGAHILLGTEKIPQPSTRPTKSQLWRIDIKSNDRRLLSEGDALQPNYSPNKQRIAYWSRPSKAGQREEIWTIPADGGEAVAVTNGSTTDLNPVWSPDGKYLYFSSNRGGSMNVWRVAIDENTGATLGEPQAVTTIGATTSVLQLGFSRDGRRLAYSAQEEIRNLRKVGFNPDTGKAGGEPVSVTRGSMQLWFPDASPDGEWLACYSMGQQRHIFIMRTDGTDLRDLTNDNYRHFWPRWSPDGKRITFSSRRTGNYEIWVINRDGSGLQQLTSGHQSPGAHYSVWSPDGSRMAYSIHAPKNDCVIFQLDRPWSEQTPEAISPLSDPSLSFEGWSWSADGKKLAGIKHLPSGVHSGIGAYDLESKTYDWLTDFGDWPLWLNDNRHLLFVSQGQILLFDTSTRKYQPVLTVTDQDVDIGSPAISRDNRMIYFSFVETQADIWLMDLQ